MMNVSNLLSRKVCILLIKSGSLPTATCECPQLTLSNCECTIVRAGHFVFSNTSWNLIFGLKEVEEWEKKM
jgi:hypothetical protein